MKPQYVKHRIANLISINKIVTIHYYEFGRGFSFGGEVHDFWEMVYVDRGRVSITADNRSFCLEQGEVAFHKPNEFHSIRTADTAADVFVITFVCSSAAMDFFKKRVAKVPKKLRENISSIIEESSATFNLMPITGVELELKEDAPVGGQQLIRLHLEELLIMLLRSGSSEKNTALFPTKESMESHLVSRAKEILQNGIYSRMTVDEVCRRLNYSRAYLSKIFKASTGKTILEYLLSLKIKEAKRLIREDSINFTQISDKLAFDNPQYFSRVFKRITNFTPSQYKNSVL